MTGHIYGPEDLLAALLIGFIFGAFVADTYRVVQIRRRRAKAQAERFENEVELPKFLRKQAD